MFSIEISPRWQADGPLFQRNCQNFANTRGPLFSDLFNAPNAAADFGLIWPTCAADSTPDYYEFAFTKIPPAVSAPTIRKIAYSGHRPMIARGNARAFARTFP